MRIMSTGVAFLLYNLYRRWYSHTRCGYELEYFMGTQCRACVWGNDIMEQSLQLMGGWFDAIAKCIRGEWNHGYMSTFNPVLPCHPFSVRDNNTGKNVLQAEE